ncbi:TPA: hypothetical protein P6M77_001511 [Pseudomonas aeruginosa]|uniref:hypothetical protein n=1 Tax=Pseudomonas aeruginosa TaxID=287 RepID=UPI00071C0F67|nr:hypothetical protein [Pseudomonas aeruginosa]AYW60736.1 hypothetical protein EGV93_17835 [Pseudomonas aeruginosa]KSP34859.1 hypothetical protein APB15_29900 [Pseudomonas aeruginosa]UOC61070.1 hypothetical protein IPV49_17360 [Pseudomonas aeruginosa]UOC67155.1 hypothetical protein IPV48_17335 [Pseudomonas aeruginosa]UOC73239.1 hypothetical protein IPV46_17360 [Pseudomonas aeruginosa]
MKNSIYWAFNLPLQVWPIHKDEDDESSAITDFRILNYMPRKERICEVYLSEVIGEQSREEFLETAALHFENLARLFRSSKSDPGKHIYYHDDGMEKQL